MGMVVNNPIPTATYKVVLDYHTALSSSVSSDTDDIDTDSYESAVIAPSDMLNSNKVIIFATLHSAISCAIPRTADTGIKIETKAPAGAYTADIDAQHYFLSGSSYSVDGAKTDSVFIIHTLTAAEKLNGLQIKFTTRAQSYNAGGPHNATASISSYNLGAFSLS